MTAFVVIVTDPEAIGYNRSPFNRNVHVSFPYRVERFDHAENELSRQNAWWMCESQAWAEQTAQDLAKRYPTKIVKVAQITCEFQSEAPKVAKKVVSERGVLPG